MAQILPERFRGGRENDVYEPMLDTPKVVDQTYLAEIQGAKSRRAAHPRR
jgi:hypothetical protein